MGLGKRKDQGKLIVVSDEASYRSLPIDSYSSIKEFTEDRIKYYKKYILKEAEEEKDNAATFLGKLVETRLFEPELTEKKFYPATFDKKPTGKVLAFTEALFELTKNSLDDKGKITRTIEDMATEARVMAEYADSYKLETVVKNFREKGGEPYYDSLLESIGKMVVSEYEWSVADVIVNQLKTKFPNLARPTDDTFIRLAQVKIHEDFEIEGVPIKSMLDLIEIDLEELTVQPIDLKVTYTVENFFWEYYLKRKSFYQGYIYNRAVETDQFRKILMEYLPEEIIDQLTFLPFKFIVADSKAQLEPLCYEFDEYAEHDAWEGFLVGNKPCRGLKYVLQDLKWAKDTDTWKISRKNSGLETLRLSNFYRRAPQELIEVMC